MSNFILNYLIKSSWEGKRATDQAGRDLEDLGKKGGKAATGTDKVSESLGGLGSKISGLVTGGALIAAGYMLADFAGEAISAASDVEEAYGKFNVVFGEYATQTDANLQQLADTTKRSKYDLIEYAATLQDTFVPLGYARDEAAEMSEQLVALAVDLASFNNAAEADVVRDLQSAMVGNTETLRKYGVIAQDVQIKQEALALGLWDGTGAIDAQTKANAILSLTMKGTTDAQGDAVRTSDRNANVSRDLDSALTDLSVTMGTKLLPAATQSKARMADLTRQTMGFLESQFELEDGLSALNKAYQDGVISQELYNKAANEIQFSMENAGQNYAAAILQIDLQAAALDRLEESWRVAGAAKWDYYRDLYQRDPGDPVEKIVGYTGSNMFREATSGYAGGTQQRELISWGNEVNEVGEKVRRLGIMEDVTAAKNAALTESFRNSTGALGGYTSAAKDLEAEMIALASATGDYYEQAEKSEDVDPIKALKESMQKHGASAYEQYLFDIESGLKSAEEAQADLNNAFKLQKADDIGALLAQGLSAEEAIASINDTSVSAEEYFKLLDEETNKDYVTTLDADTDPFYDGYEDVMAWKDDLSKPVVIPIYTEDNTDGGGGGGNNDDDNIPEDPNEPPRSPTRVVNYYPTTAAAMAAAQGYERIENRRVLANSLQRRL